MYIENCCNLNDCDWDPVWKRFMEDSGFPRTPDRSVKLLGTCVRYLRSVETSIGARGLDFLGGSATHKTTKMVRADQGLQFGSALPSRESQCCSRCT